jgi:uncharacterized protein YjgD (DUF1641 family)
MSTAVAADRIEALEAKIDALSGELGYVAEQLREMEVRRLRWDELRHDMAPIATEVFQLAARELDEVKDFVTPEDLLRLVKHLARNLRNLEALLGQMESLSELARDVTPLTNQMMLQAMEGLDEFERKGYFAFVRAGMGVLDEIVTSYSEEDVKALGDNVVLILDTVKEMTQPEVMRLVGRTVHTVREAEAEEIGLLRFMWRMRDPKVRRGLSKVLAVLESMSGDETTQDTPAAAGEDA